MIRAAVYNADVRECRRVRGRVEQCLEARGYRNVEVLLSTSIEELCGQVKARRADFFDVLLCIVEPNPEQVLSRLHELRDGGCAVPLVLAALDETRAADAFALDAAGYVVLPAKPGHLEEALARALARGGEKRRGGIFVKARKTIESIRFDSVLFVETARSGLLIHLPAGAEMAVNSTLQALFDRLSDDPRFARVGSSFIVNLDNVRSYGEGALIFADGETVIVPMRVRKAVQESLDAYRSAGCNA